MSTNRTAPLPRFRPRSHRLLLAAVILTVGFTLSACGEVLNEFYISNHTDEAIAVTMQPRFIDEVELHSGELIDSVKSSVRASLPDALPFERDGDLIRFSIPAQTTAFIGFSGGGQQPFETLQIEANGSVEEIDGSNYRDHFSIHDRLVGVIVHALVVR